LSDDNAGGPEKREIVIVRRPPHGHDDGHHGGVWKIAYADFMTAMMAFFLVMWLVNAANEETKAAIASYFNPIELMDQKPTDRSIREEGQSADGNTELPSSDTQGEGTTDAENEQDGNQENATAGEETQYSEADYFENPYAVLAEIALEVGQQANVSDAGEGGAQTSGPASGASGGEAYRDPFDPDFWSQEMQDREEVDPVVPEPKDLTPAALAAAEDAPEDIAEEEQPAEEQQPVEVAALPEDASVEEVDEAAPVDSMESAEPAPAEETEEPQVDAADRLREEIETAVAELESSVADGIEVTAAEGGVLISLTDQVEDSMFNVGSAIPRREMVLAMEKIGALLAEREGEVLIRGHTDARPFEGEGNDNWRLSTDRAHSAYYMLMRGGLAEDRVAQISGFADHDLKVPEDPYAAANRRIEILVRAPNAEVP
jgi:chemotaxis protein MotB